MHMAFITSDFEPTTLVFIVLGVSGTELAFLAPCLPAKLKFWSCLFAGGRLYTCHYNIDRAYVA
jgi:hypothetical protein